MRFLTINFLPLKQYYTELKRYKNQTFTNFIYQC